MDVFIARQPIFDNSKNLIAYELLYRDHEGATCFGGSADGSYATRVLISDAITVFGLDNLTNGRPAFVNFTRKLIMDDFAYLCNPDEIIVEIVEDTFIDDVFVEKVKELKRAGYRIAIDDYIGDSAFDQLLEHADIIKVDILGMPLEKRVEISESVKKMGKILLAEKVETYEDYEHAMLNNYTLFQGYYLQRPKTMSKKSVNINPGSYVELIRELSKGDPDFNVLTAGVRKNVGLTYKLLQHINTLRYFRYFRVKSIRMALVTLGLDEVRRWILLMMAKDMGQKNNDEVIKMAFVRGFFAEKLSMKTRHKHRSSEVFIMGMFSLMDIIAETDLKAVLRDLPLEPDVTDAILGKESDIAYILEYARAFEMGDWEKLVDLGHHIRMTEEEIGKLYIDCMMYADSLFALLPQK